jgi:hypothetical protein
LFVYVRIDLFLLYHFLVGELLLFGRSLEFFGLAELFLLPVLLRELHVRGTIHFGPHGFLGVLFGGDLSLLGQGRGDFLFGGLGNFLFGRLGDFLFGEFGDFLGFLAHFLGFGNFLADFLLFRNCLSGKSHSGRCLFGSGGGRLADDEFLRWGDDKLSGWCDDKRLRLRRRRLADLCGNPHHGWRALLEEFGLELVDEFFTVCEPLVVYEFFAVCELLALVLELAFLPLVLRAVDPRRLFLAEHHRGDPVRAAALLAW